MAFFNTALVRTIITFEWLAESHGFVHPSIPDGDLFFSSAEFRSSLRGGVTFWTPHRSLFHDKKNPMKSPHVRVVKSITP